MKTAELCRCRVGHVSSVDPAAGTVRVVFDDKQGLVSYNLPVLQRNTLKNKDEAWPDPGEHVVCLFLGNGLEQGFVLGAIYDRKNRPPIGDQDVRAITFEDGTTVKVDRKNHRVDVQDSFGSYIRMEGGYIRIKAAVQTIIER